MFAARSRQRDLVALALGALALFLALALATYDPADPPSSVVYPVHAKAHNVCGRAGALVAFVLLEGLGWGAWYLVASLGAVTWLLVCGKEIND
ncbi:MAG TPA: DNA translocase FtsK 4TM domain-containing protein, partial [Pirellulales bacterium]|nr:DNA translocase FtsK 4TM domain-containing protein [Pirellulales bacterium]